MDNVIANQTDWFYDENQVDKMDNVTANQTDWYYDKNQVDKMDNATANQADWSYQDYTRGMNVLDSFGQIHIGLISLISLASFIGNGVIFAVVMSKRKSGISTTYYLFGTLAVFDVLVTCYNVCGLFIHNIYGSVFAFGFWFELLYRFFGTTCADLSAWTLILISMERLASVVIPFQVKTFVTSKTIMIAEMVMASVIIVLEYFSILHYDMHFREIVFEDDYPLDEYNRIQLAVFLFLILTPFAVIIVSSIIIIVKIRTSIGGNKPRINSVTRNLLAVNVAYIITQFPSTILTIMILGRLSLQLHEHIWFMKINEEDLAPVLAHYCAEILRASNHAMNCLAYVLSGRTFRDDVRNMICKQRSVR